jgi:RimJ/RimL family protein N-acetyltransferase
MVDIDGIAEREGTLGYWLDRAAWGCGYAFEAAHAVTRFAFEDVGLTCLKAGHADDNPASGRILTKLGFTLIDTVKLFFAPPRREYYAAPLQAHVSRRLSGQTRADDRIGSFFADVLPLSRRPSPHLPETDLI